MQSLRRHRLAYLRPAAWRDIAARAWDPVARKCLSHWADHELPLVVTRQLADIDGIALGLSAPLAWERRRVALHVAHDGIERFDEFPTVREALAHLPAAARAALSRVLPCAEALGAQQPRIYGSHGWQVVTGLPCVHDASDIDLWFAVDDVDRADAVAFTLCATVSAPSEPRLDGELVLPDGSAVAWREWATWRAAGMRGPMLVKRIDGATLEDGHALRARTVRIPPLPRAVEGWGEGRA